MEAGFYRTSGPFTDDEARDYPCVQIVTIDDLLHGKKPDLPLLVLESFQKAPKVKKDADQMQAFG